ncbi:MAG: TlpA family protein disulfide reductase [Acidobacteria bacterium]|nr:TlpA family protein disulfide reductase [Acidobacteriota bacterium]
MLNVRRRVGFVLLATCAFAFTLMPSAYAQRNVHAVLVASANRKSAPVFHLSDSNGKKVQISDFRGKVVLVNFWATECGGCVLEIPSFIELHHAYSDKGFTALGISADIPYEGLKNEHEAWAKVRPFVSSHHVNYPIVMGNDAVIESYGFASYPATYLIDKSGRIAATYIGIVSKDDVEANIKRLLAE